MTYSNLAFIGNIGTSEILVILLIVLLVFGAKRIPELARSLGKASREFKDARDGVITELEKEPAEKKTSDEQNNESGKHA
jgi:TatA/E family protein of Tat protein translocase